ncbi:MAG: hypothetical protein LBJ96_05600 [Holosporaceae bacterium]|jgi:hypothetical protein|nr:hypothetical protein [Holosporaceae bacterium]
MKKEIIYAVILAFVFAGMNSVDAAFKIGASDTMNSNLSAAFGKTVKSDLTSEEKAIGALAQLLATVSKSIQAINKTYEVMPPAEIKKFEIIAKELKKSIDAFQKAKDFKRKPFEDMFAASNKNKLDPEVTKKVVSDTLTAIGDALEVAKQTTDKLNDEKVRDSRISKFKKKRDDAEKALAAAQKAYDDSLGTLKQAVQQFSEKGKEFLAEMDVTQTEAEKKNAAIPEDEYNPTNKVRDLFALVRDLKEAVREFRSKVAAVDDAEEVGEEEVDGEEIDEEGEQEAE